MKIMKIFDTVIIGTGPCAEPALFHFSRTDLNCLVLDAGDINKYAEKIERSKKNIKISPKQKLNKFKWFDKVHFQKINTFFFLRCFKFCYIYTFRSGGLSNSWGGGAFEWSSEELKKATSISYEKILKSYDQIRNRLSIKKRNSFSNFSKLACDLLKNKNNNFIYAPAEFFLEENYAVKDINYPFNQNLIWNSKVTLKNYIELSENIAYKNNTTVLYINKKDDNVWELCCKNDKKTFYIQTKSIVLCAGALNSACLAFSATKLKKINLNFYHNNAFIIPIISLRKKIKSLSKDYLEIPELSWREKNNKSLGNSSFSSGYFINSLFLLKEIINIFPIKNNNFLINIISQLLSRLGFITAFIPSNFSNVSLEIKKINNEIYATIFNHSDKKILRSYKSSLIQKIYKTLPKFIYTLNLFRKSVAPGGDIHYSSTLPEEIGCKTFLNTSSIGELKKLPMIFSGDPSRLAYLSSLPHTFTVMAITDASMPKIIKKIRSKR